MAPDDTKSCPCALYRSFDAEGALLYVGISLNAINRACTHSKIKMWWREVARIDIEWWPNKRAALDAESQAIWDEDPKYNIAGRKDTWLQEYFARPVEYTMPNPRLKASLGRKRPKGEWQRTLRRREQLRVLGEGEWVCYREYPKTGEIESLETWMPTEKLVRLCRLRDWLTEKEEQREDQPRTDSNEANAPLPAR